MATPKIIGALNSIGASHKYKGSKGKRYGTSMRGMKNTYRKMTRRTKRK